MKIGKKIYCLSIISLYLFVSMIWLLIYIFIGEDIALNTPKDYISFILFTCIYLLAVFIHMLISKQIVVNTLLTTIGVLITPILIMGYLGASAMNSNDMYLTVTRMIVLILHIITYGTGIIRTYNIYKQELWSNT